MVNTERVKLLVDALRSDEFKQGRGRLTAFVAPDTREDCCLGVGCTVAKRNGAQVEDRRLGGTVIYYDPATISSISSLYSDESYVFMPKVVLDWYGFDSQPRLRFRNLDALRETLSSRDDWDEDVYFNSDGTTDATDCNDDLCMTFLEIADAFEYTYLETQQANT